MLYQALSERRRSPMPRTLYVAVLLTLAPGFAASAMAQRIEIDPLLINDLKGKPASSLELLEVEFRVITLDLGRIRSSDMDRIRSLFGLTKSAIPARAELNYPLSTALRKLSPAKADGPIKHQVLETKPFQDLLSWMSARHIASNASQSGRKIALGSTVVVLDQRVSAPRLSKKKDARTGTDVHSVEFVQSGLHLELTPVTQVFPKEKGLSEVWQLRLDRVLTTLANGGDEADAKIERAKHVVTLAVGQTALIPNFVQTDRPAFVLLSVKAPKPKPKDGDILISSTDELIRIATEPGGPGLANRISQTLVPPTGTPKPRVYKPGETIATLKPSLVDVAETGSPDKGEAPPAGKTPGVVQRVIKENELSIRQGVRVLELQENEVIELVFPDKVSIVRTAGDQKSLQMVNSLEPTSLAIQAGKKGVSTLNVESGKNAGGRTHRFRIEVIVRGDTRLLSRTLEKLFPDDKVELTEVNDAIVIRGKVSQAIVTRQIVEIAEQFYPQVLDQMESRDMEQFQPARGTDKPTAAPAIGAEIRNLRTDVKSLRDEIQKLIKVIEKESSDTGTPATR